MDIDKLNAFLATAIGGIIFKWLAGAIKSCWSWLNKTHPEEQFLIDDLNFSAPTIRITYCKYKKNTRAKTTSSKYTQIILGGFIILVCLIFFYSFAKILINGPIQWVDFKHKTTQDKIWIKPGEAKNPEDKNI
ncbi:hypothetical protein [Pantoea sp. FN0307]|uniref:hypothetical protein n=1 Tax=Pantoea sp. FN0307 TaxID=3418560 RepID=UPI003CF6DDD8